MKTEVNAGHNTAANELHEAINDMSRRPQPDPTGAIQHSIASLECVARDVSGSKETLGKWLQKNRDAFPRPLGEYVEKKFGVSHPNMAVILLKQERHLWMRLSSSLD